MAKKSRRLADPIANLRALGATEDFAQDFAAAVTRAGHGNDNLQQAFDAAVKAQMAAFQGTLDAARAGGQSRYAYDIFISHSHTDLAAVEELTHAFTTEGLKVYYDEADPTLDRTRVSGETAIELQKRMRSCRALLLVVSKSSARSGWIPWEVGFFDALTGLVFTLPLDQEARDSIRQQEWHELYPELERHTAVQDFGAKYGAAVKDG